MIEIKFSDDQLDVIKKALNCYALESSKHGAGVESAFQIASVSSAIIEGRKAHAKKLKEEERQKWLKEQKKKEEDES